MASFQFERELEVSAPQDEVWHKITDVQRVVGWISVCRDARELAPLERYSAVLEDRLGMFSLRADLDIVVSEVERASRLRARAEGQDRQVGSRIVIDGLVELRPRGDGSQVRVSGAYEVTGRVATLGASSIRHKGDKVLGEFFDNVGRELSSR
ncbi:MAG: CoxG family protein [Nocardioidaceae bacterium]